MPSSHLILCHPLLLLPPIPPSIRVFSNESALRMRWPKYWSFRFSISPANEHPGLISFRKDWLDLLAVQGTLKHLLQHHSISSSALIFLYGPTLTSGSLQGPLKPSTALGSALACGSLWPPGFGVEGGFRLPWPSPEVGSPQRTCCHPRHRHPHQTGVLTGWGGVVNPNPNLARGLQPLCWLEEGLTHWGC